MNVTLVNELESRIAIFAKKLHDWESKGEDENLVKDQALVILDEIKELRK